MDGWEKVEGKGEKKRQYSSIMFCILQLQFSMEFELSRYPICFAII